MSVTPFKGVASAAAVDSRVAMAADKVTPAGADGYPNFISGTTANVTYDMALMFGQAAATAIPNDIAIGHVIVSCSGDWPSGSLLQVISNDEAVLSHSLSGSGGALVLPLPIEWLKGDTSCGILVGTGEAVLTKYISVHGVRVGRN